MTANTPTLGFLIHDVARLWRKRFEQLSRDSGLTRSQWQVLAYLERNENIHQSGLAELLEVEPITLGRIVDRLQEFGLVERHPHPSDRRIWLLRLTPRAKPKLDELHRLGGDTRAEVLAGIADADQDHLMQTLTALKANLTAACSSPGLIKQGPVAQKRASQG